MTSQKRDEIGVGKTVGLPGFLKQEAKSSKILQEIRSLRVIYAGTIVHPGYQGSLFLAF